MPHISVEKSFGWGSIGMKKFPELVPLVAILALPCTGAVLFMGYSLYQKPDVTVKKSSRIDPPWEQLNPEKSQKFLTIRQKYAKIEELEKLRKEIGSYKA